MAGTSYAPSYQDYLSAYKGQDQSAFSESGQSNEGPMLSQDDWNNLSDVDKLNSIGFGGSHGAENGNVYWIQPDDPRYADLAKQTGVESGRAIAVTSEINNPGSKDWWVDPSKNVNVGNGLYAFAPNNLTPKAEQQAKSYGWIIPLAIATMGAGALAAGAEGGTLAAGATNVGATGIGTGIAGDVTGAGVTAAGGGAVAGGAADAANTVESQLAANGSPYEANMYATAGGPATEATGVTGDISAADGLPADLGAPSNGGIISGAQGTAAGTTGSSTGFSLPSWYTNASPVTRMVIGQAISAGARGMLSSIAQRNAQNFAREQQQQQIDQWNQSHRVGAFSDSAFTPKTPGIISGANGG